LIDLIFKIWAFVLGFLALLAIAVGLVCASIAIVTRAVETIATTTDPWYVCVGEGSVGFLFLLVVVSMVSIMVYAIYGMVK